MSDILKRVSGMIKDAEKLQFHQANKAAMQSLEFHKHQLETFRKELQLVIDSHPDALSLVEHVEEYRSIFLKKSVILDEIATRIKTFEHQLVEGMEGINAREEFENIQSLQRDFAHRFDTLKKNFRRFVSHNMH